MLVDGLHIDHLRLILGTSMGGMQTWMWGERYPQMMDGLVPIASQPVAIAGRNWLWRQVIISAIRNGPDWHGGDYGIEDNRFGYHNGDLSRGLQVLFRPWPTQWIRTMPVLALMTGDPAGMYATAPDRAASVRMYDTLVEQAAMEDANDVLYAFESARDYDPESQLSKIRAPLYAINFTDNLLDTTDSCMEQKLIHSIPLGRYQDVFPGNKQYGHMTLAHPEVWKGVLTDLLSYITERQSTTRPIGWLVTFPGDWCPPGPDCEKCRNELY